jgi:hypothetical protein
MDIQDGEQIIGLPQDEWVKPSPTKDDPDNKILTKPIETATAMLWLMARKDGVPIKEQAQRKWKWTYDEFKCMVTMQDLQVHGEAVGNCFYGGQGAGEGRVSTPENGAELRGHDHNASAGRRPAHA